MKYSHLGALLTHVLNIANQNEHIYKCFTPYLFIFAIDCIWGHLILQIIRFAKINDREN